MFPGESVCRADSGRVGEEGGRAAGQVKLGFYSGFVFSFSAGWPE